MIDYRLNLLASAIAALCSRLIVHPMDTLKTRIQTSKTIDLQQNQFKLTLTMIQSMIKNESILSFYQGLFVSLLFCIPALCTYLVSYDISKDYITTAFFSDEGNSTADSTIQKDTWLVYIVCGAIAEFASNFFWCPMEVIKTKLQSRQYNSQYSISTWDVVTRIYKDGGLLGFFRGFWISMLVFIPHSSLYFVVYESIKSEMVSLGYGPDSTSLTWPCYLFGSSVAGIIASAFSNIFDVIKTVYQSSYLGDGEEVLLQEQEDQTLLDSSIPLPPTRGKRVSAFEYFKREYKHAGVYRTFFKGLLARILFMVPNIIISFTVYETLKNTWKDVQ